jgi:hypothetical protein
VYVSPLSDPDFCRTATPIALWQYGRRRDCRDYQRHECAFTLCLAVHIYTSRSATCRPGPGWHGVVGRTPL